MKLEMDTLYKTDLHLLNLLLIQILILTITRETKRALSLNKQRNFLQQAPEWAAPLWFDAPLLPLIAHNAKYEHQHLDKIKHFNSLLSNVQCHVINTENTRIYLYSGRLSCQCQEAHFGLM